MSPGGGVPVKLLTGMPYQAAVVLVGAAMIIYVAFGGMHLGADRQGGAPKSFDRSSLLGDHAASAEPGEAPARPRQVAGKQPEARRRVPVAPFCR